eukprot:3390660-Pyramimonas_sp.AAC.1
MAGEVKVVHEREHYRPLHEYRADHVLTPGTCGRLLAPASCFLGREVGSSLPLATLRPPSLVGELSGLENKKVQSPPLYWAPEGPPNWPPEGPP